ncbi:hypothetical protein [Streptomyces sp. B6B3]|uniref:hypothetical protein n=1 Tax=Streptomyces sp. B6B3 TaxID=3153570 RepID=UPI00325DD652
MPIASARAEAASDATSPIRQRPTARRSRAGADRPGPCCPYPQAEGLGTVFPLVTAVGTPVVGCTDPELSVPDYLLAVCSSTLGVPPSRQAGGDPAEAVAAVAGARLPDRATLEDAVGPVGGSAARLLDAWRERLGGAAHGVGQADSRITREVGSTT